MFACLQCVNDFLYALVRTKFEPVILTKAFANHTSMHIGILAYVQRYQVEAEGMNTPQQALHGEQAGVPALVAGKALGD